MVLHPGVPTLLAAVFFERLGQHLPTLPTEIRLLGEECVQEVFQLQGGERGLGVDLSLAVDGEDLQACGSHHRLCLTAEKEGILVGKYKQLHYQ